jgi:hypothetical protein
MRWIITKQRDQGYCHVKSTGVCSIAIVTDDNVSYFQHNRIDLVDQTRSTISLMSLVTPNIDRFIADTTTTTSNINKNDYHYYSNYNASRTRL